MNGKIAKHLKGEYMKFKIIVAYFLPSIVLTKTLIF